MSSLSFQSILDYRAQTFRTAAGRRITSKEEAVAFGNERGYIYFWPIKEVTLPSLWAVAAGDRPVPDEHDDPGHVTWGWKDEMLGARQWYYAKVLRKRATYGALLFGGTSGITAKTSLTLLIVSGSIAYKRDDVLSYTIPSRK